MKRFNKIKELLLLCLFLLSLSPLPSFAQPTATGPCDTCTAPWGPVTQKVYYSQTVPFLSPSCLYNVHLSIQTRICGGKLQVRMLDQYIEPLSDSSACTLYCINAGYLMQKISKLLLMDLGGNIVLNKPSACYYLLEYELSPGLKACLGKEAGYFRHWYSLIPCDATGCCITEYVLQADGSVRAVSTVSTPCVAPPPSPVPPSITIYCWSMGVRTAYVVNVVPPTTPLTCEVVCHTPGSVFWARTTGISGQEMNNAHLIYPNPANDEIYISEGTRWEKLVIVDMQGKTIQTHYNTGKAVNVKQLIPGTYLLLLENAAGVQQKQLMIKN